MHPTPMRRGAAELAAERLVQIRRPRGLLDPETGQIDVPKGVGIILNAPTSLWYQTISNWAAGTSPVTLGPHFSADAAMVKRIVDIGFVFASATWWDFAPWSVGDKSNAVWQTMRLAMAVRYLRAMSAFVDPTLDIVVDLILGPRWEEKWEAATAATREDVP